MFEVAIDLVQHFGLKRRLRSGHDQQVAIGRNLPGAGQIDLLEGHVVFLQHRGKARVAQLTVLALRVMLAVVFEKIRLGLARAGHRENGRREQHLALEMGAANLLALTREQRLEIEH